ncbi:3D domain-containing protein [Neobacillus sp. PS3-34]|uniref:3D domain-containing protein n=1 Tax=Neobacillus sp. PS3-34 TaxID=3070678 RepID=UPI0027E0C510|nr:3D domain-containing protein [Neobacillus sp. PS3-34]WML50430.1 3D domain-containing protein [Neobacillus sp. PS3-34]
MKKILLTLTTAFFFIFGFNNGALAASNTYTVKSGDSLYKIAKTYHISISQLKQMNHLASDKIKINQKLTVKLVKASATVVKKQTAAVKKQSPAVVKEFKVQASAYTMNCKSCSGITATGINLKKNPNQKVISVDPKFIKLGTKVYVEGYGYAIAADKGSAIKGNVIDIFFPSQKQAINWGRKTVTIKILK